MKLIVPASLLLISLAACTAPDGELLIKKPGCGLIGCGGAGSYSEYQEAIGSNRSEPVSYGRSSPTTYRVNGNVVYGSDGTYCRRSEGITGTIYCN